MGLAEISIILVMLGFNYLFLYRNNKIYGLLVNLVIGIISMYVGGQLVNPEKMLFNSLGFIIMLISILKIVYATIKFWFSRKSKT